MGFVVFGSVKREVNSRKERVFGSLRRHSALDARVNIGDAAGHEAESCLPALAL